MKRPPMDVAPRIHAGYDRAVERIYFDNAATSSPKPETVWHAMADYATRLGGSPGRGAYFESREAGRLMRLCRERICRLINGESADHVVFALNTSDALNLAIKGILLPRLARGDPVHAVTSWMDHNSVLRPLNALAEMFPGRVEITRLRPESETTRLDPAALRTALKARGSADLVAINHVSNVTGVVQPVEEMGSICREFGAVFLVDGAQSLGHIAVDVRKACIDLLAFPGHKGLLGPTGTGGLYITPGTEQRLSSVREGGTGSRSESAVQPGNLPDKYEPGSQNAVGVIGLSEGVRYLLEFEHAGMKGMEAVEAHEHALIEVFLEGVGRVVDDGLARLMGPRETAARTGVFTFAFRDLDPHAAAAILESEFGILTRAGLHCAPLAHEHLSKCMESTGSEAGEPGLQGGVRLSLGPFHTPEQVRRAAAAVAEVAESTAAHAR